MAWSVVTPSSTISSLSLDNSNSLFTTCYTPTNSPLYNYHTKVTIIKSHTSKSKHQPHYLLPIKKHNICKAAAEYQFPDPIPEFAISETEKFKAHLVKKLTKKDLYGDKLDEVVGVCTEIFSTFLHTEYGGPGTLLVLPFIDMADTINERGLPGGPQAARAAVKWAQANVDNDWDEWNNNN